MWSQMKKSDVSVVSNVVVSDEVVSNELVSIVCTPNYAMFTARPRPLTSTRSQLPPVAPKTLRSVDDHDLRSLHTAGGRWLTPWQKSIPSRKFLISWKAKGKLLLNSASVVQVKKIYGGYERVVVRPKLNTKVITKTAHFCSGINMLRQTTLRMPIVLKHIYKPTFSQQLSLILCQNQTFPRWLQLHFALLSATLRGRDIRYSALRFSQNCQQLLIQQRHCNGFDWAQRHCLCMSAALVSEKVFAE